MFIDILKVVITLLRWADCCLYSVMAITDFLFFFSIFAIKFLQLYDAMRIFDAFILSIRFLLRFHIAQSLHLAISDF